MLSATGSLTLPSPEKKKRIRSKSILCILCALVIGIGWVVLQEEKAPPEAPKKQTDPAPALSGADGQSDNLDLALQNISLSQGESGFELWRLKAEWANMRKEADIIVVDEPRLTYFMKEEDAPPLLVNSHTGEVEQKKQLLRFMEDVHVRQEGKHIAGEVLVYNGADKTMTFPDGGVFTDTGVWGTGRRLIWYIDAKVITAEGDVSISFNQQETDDAFTPPAGAAGRPVQE